VGSSLLGDCPLSSFGDIDAYRVGSRSSLLSESTEKGEQEKGGNPISAVRTTDSTQF